MDIWAAPFSNEGDYHFRKHALRTTHMTFEERFDLVLALGRTLYVNGQSTDQTLAAANSTAIRHFVEEGGRRRPHEAQTPVSWACHLR
jgi:hypothetical protein